MSYNHNDPEKAARNHKPAIIAIIVALTVAVIAFLVFTPGANEQNDGITTTPPPAGAPISDAEGLGGSAPPVTPGADTPGDATAADQAGPAGEPAPAN